MKFAYFVPLLLLQVPNAVVSAILFTVQQPPPPLQLAGYLFFNVMVCVTYWQGLRMVLKDASVVSNARSSS